MTATTTPIVDRTASSVAAHADVHRLFALHGLRATRQRLAVYDALAATQAHPTADELFRMIGNGQRDMSLATVYNTLEALCRAGLAQKISGCAGSARYDATVHDHLHLRDEFTGGLADVPDELSRQILNAIPPQILRQLEARPGFRVDRLRVELVGRYDERTPDLGPEQNPVAP